MVFSDFEEELSNWLLRRWNVDRTHMALAFSSTIKKTTLELIVETWTSTCSISNLIRDPPEVLQLVFLEKADNKNQSAQRQDQEENFWVIHIHFECNQATFTQKFAAAVELAKAIGKNSETRIFHWFDSVLFQEPLDLDDPSTLDDDRGFYSHSF